MVRHKYDDNHQLKSKSQINQTLRKAIFPRSDIMRNIIPLFLPFLLLTFSCSKTNAQLHLVEDFKPEEPAKGFNRLLFLAGQHPGRYNVTLGNSYEGQRSEITCGYKNNNGQRYFLSPCQVSVEKVEKQEFLVICNKYVKEEYASIEFNKDQVPAFTIPSTSKHVWAGFTSDPPNSKLKRPLNGEKILGKEVKDNLIVNCYSDKRKDLE